MGYGRRLGHVRHMNQHQKEVTEAVIRQLNKAIEENNKQKASSLILWMMDCFFDSGDVYTINKGWEAKDGQNN